MLKADNIDGFLKAYELYACGRAFDLRTLAITQVDFPAALRRKFKAKTASAETVVAVWRLVSSGQLLLVEDDLRKLVNQHLSRSLKQLQLSSELAVQLLPILGAPLRKTKEPIQAQKTAHQSQNTAPMNRVSIVSTFSVRAWSASSAFNLGRNLCNSPQEREFLQALRLYFPAMQCYPNVVLRSFLTHEEIGRTIPERFRDFIWKSRVGALLCTLEEDPIAGFELDSSWNDNEKSANRDDMKNAIFKLAKIPLIRIRPNNPDTVRAEDFYDLLKAEAAEALIRPHRMRQRRSHDGLIPTGVNTVQRW